MILTVTLNAAIDKTYVLSCENCPGEVLRVVKCLATPGGKGLNVTKAVRALGERVTATGILGGHAGKWIQESLENRGIDCSFLWADDESRTCINVVEPGGRQTEFLEPGLDTRPGFAAEFEQHFTALMEQSRVVILSGSLPRGFSSSFYARLIQACRERGKTVILDSSGEALCLGVAAGPSLVKPNLDELTQLLGHAPGDSPEEAAIDGRRLREAGVRSVVISMGRKGAVLVSEEGAFHARPPKVQAVSATGSGDCMTAGLGVGALYGWGPEKTLRCATAAAAANAMELETGRIAIENYRRLLPLVEVSAIG